MIRVSAERHGARLIWPTVAMLAALAILLGLGTWQLQRKAWKEALIQRLAEQLAAPPQALTTRLVAASSGVLTGTSARWNERGYGAFATNSVAIELANSRIHRTNPEARRPIRQTLHVAPG